jgi:hypothetical protein
MRRPRHLRETLAGLLVLAALALLARWIYLRQFEFNPAIRAAQTIPNCVPAPPSLERAPVTFTLADYLPDGLVPVGPPETFDRETLSARIGSRSQIYLDAGFLALDCQRFCYKDDPGLWMEAFIYDMREPRRAFAVFCAQRREAGDPLDFPGFAYRTSKAVFAVHGSRYIEIVASDPIVELVADMESFVRRFISSHPDGNEPLPELELLPARGRDEESLALLLENAFGCELLDNIFAADYRLDGALATGFVSLRDTPADAVSLLTAYCEHLLDNGATEENFEQAAPGSRILNLFGTYVLVFAEGRALGGVYQADSIETADRLASLMRERIARRQP